jgi:hypothetical protein
LVYITPNIVENEEHKAVVVSAMESIYRYDRTVMDQEWTRSEPKAVIVYFLIHWYFDNSRSDQQRELVNSQNENRKLKDDKSVLEKSVDGLRQQNTTLVNSHSDIQQKLENITKFLQGKGIQYHA